MIDEELYKIATEELNSDERNPEVWTRACALASGDHDEARYLYTNLRVEEMLSEQDGVQRTFSASRLKEERELSNSDELDNLSDSLGDDTSHESIRTNVNNTRDDDHLLGALEEEEGDVLEIDAEDDGMSLAEMASNIDGEDDDMSLAEMASSIDADDVDTDTSLIEDDGLDISAFEETSVEVDDVENTLFDDDLIDNSLSDDGIIDEQSFADSVPEQNVTDQISFKDDSIDLSNVEAVTDFDMIGDSKDVVTKDSTPDRSYTSVMDSDITGDMLELSPSDGNANLSDSIVSDMSEEAIHDMETPEFMTPEAQRTAELAKDFERQAQDIGHIDGNNELLHASDDLLDANEVAVDHLANDSVEETVSDSLSESLDESFSDSVESMDADVEHVLDDSEVHAFDSSINEPVETAYENVLDETGTADLEAAVSEPLDSAFDESLEDTSVADLEASLAQSDLAEDQTEQAFEAVQEAEAELEDDSDDAFGELLNNLSRNSYNDADVAVDLAEGTDAADAFNAADAIAPAVNEFESEAIMDDLSEELEGNSSSAIGASAAIAAGSAAMAGLAHSADPREQVKTDYATDKIDNDDASEEDLVEVSSDGGKSFMVLTKDGVHKAIKQGASWPALFFTFPWLLSKTMFGTALVYGCLWCVSLAGLLFGSSLWMNAGADASLAVKLWTACFALLALIGLVYIPFRYGNDWVADKLQNKGFTLLTEVNAKSKRDALSSLLGTSN